MPWIDQRGPPDATCGFGQPRAGRTPLPRRPIWDCWGFETPAVIALAYWTGSNIASRSQTGSKADQGQHEIARPLRRERVNSSAGSKASRTAQIIRLALTGHQTTVTSRLSHWARDERCEQPAAAPKASTTLADADVVRPTPTWRMTWRDHRGVPPDICKPFGSA